MATAPGLPHFIVIGAMKCGTTTLYRHLADHPQIDMSRDKETDFFVAEKNWDRGLDWYAAQFSGRGPVRGEASPNYTKRRDFPGVPARIAAACPEVRLIYILRDPVARAESQLRHGIIMGDLSPAAEGFTDSHEYAHILDASRYAHQLEPYLAQFGRAAILVLDFDDLRRDPQTVMDRVHAHVGVAPRPIGRAGAANDSRELARVPAPALRFARSPLGRRVAGLVGRDTRDRIRAALARGRDRRPEALPEALRARMRDDLAPDAARLRAMTGLDFPGWSV
ncbi:sulfotransferase family protein [Jannaschia ovalis]|uniref:Sulfotransferase n=1 Tax=Jannaschia ovalis TaxID=3038773 RepID=A0ABY8LC78_9RHOB|nr:sulfotransferase [Jannaschia sp. GRR-S6-38]WGH78922.1 sulfotransferase [Jannaschia sp. GRR-S6-38]